MMLIDWLFDNIFVVFILGAFISWIGKWMKALEETVERKEQREQQEQQSTAVLTEVEPRTRRTVNQKQEQVVVSQPTAKQQTKAKQLPTHPLVQGVIFSEVFGPPRAKRPFGRK
ncbi:hypothetical protein H919_00250 [Anoxybacillus flavithermus AK1]|uniref:Uncharacterized protein n=2 Tax=Anoxybacillaceae TaxID=3120669 RepID=M8E2B0_9BACL|nr:hypothetical protein H919_00250 [Anoxybacillus flavithermus AK1]